MKDKDCSPRILFLIQIPLIIESIKMLKTVCIIILNHDKELTCPTEVKQLSELRCIHSIHMHAFLLTFGTLKWWGKSLWCIVKRKNGKGKPEVTHG